MGVPLLIPNISHLEREQNVWTLKFCVTSQVLPCFFFLSDVDFNVSGMFAMPTGPVHQPGHPATPEPEYATIERRRPGSQGASETETPRKDRYPSHPRLHRQDSRSTTVSAMYVVANESVTVKADSPSPEAVKWFAYAFIFKVFCLSVIILCMLHYINKTFVFSLVQTW